LFFNTAQRAFVYFLLFVWGMELIEMGVQLFLAEKHYRTTSEPAIHAEKRFGRMLPLRVNDQIVLSRETFWTRGAAEFFGAP